MTPFLLLYMIFCGFTLGSYWHYMGNREAKEENIFWKWGNAYDRFFFNHGEPTADQPKPE